MVANIEFGCHLHLGIRLPTSNEIDFLARNSFILSPFHLPCRKPGGQCSYVSHHYKSQCSQVYNYHRLLSWNKERGLHMDIYKVKSSVSNKNVKN